MACVAAGKRSAADSGGAASAAAAAAASAAGWDAWPRRLLGLRRRSAALGRSYIGAPCGSARRSSRTWPPHCSSPRAFLGTSPKTLLHTGHDERSPAVLSSIVLRTSGIAVSSELRVRWDCPRQSLWSAMRSTLRISHFLFGRALRASGCKTLAGAASAVEINQLRLKSLASSTVGSRDTLATRRRRAGQQIKAAQWHASQRSSSRPPGHGARSRCCATATVS